MRADEPLAGAGARETQGRNEMFEQSFVEGVAKTNRGWPVAASLMLQMSVVSVGVLIPLLNPELLPRAVVAATLLTAPPLPPPPPPRLPAHEMTRMVHRARSFLDAGRLMAPFAYPKKARIFNEMEEPPISGIQGGVEGGVSYGQADGVLNSLITRSHQPPPPDPAPQVKETAPAKPIPRTTMGGNVVEALIVNKVIPVYPVMAKQTRTEGKVVFQAVISREGTIQSLRTISGHPMLVQAAMDAVRQWRYRPSMLNGEPCEVDTVITVNFTLNR